MDNAKTGLGSGTTVTRVTQPASRTADARLNATSAEREVEPAARVHGEPSLVDAMHELVAVLDHAAEELLAAVPYLGDQHTGAVVNAYVDEMAAALHELRSDADDLRRVLAIAEQRPPGGP